MGSARFLNRFVFEESYTQMEMMNEIQRTVKLWACQYGSFDFKSINIQFEDIYGGRHAVLVEIYIDFK